MAHKAQNNMQVPSPGGDNPRTVIPRKNCRFRPFSRAPQSFSVPPLPTDYTLPERSYQQGGILGSDSNNVVEDPEDAKICTVDSRLSLQSAFALSVTMLPEPRFRRYARSPPPIFDSHNRSIMVTVDVEQVDDGGNSLPESDAPAPHWPSAVNARAQPLGTGIIRSGSCPPGRGSAYFDFDSASTNKQANPIYSPPPVPTTPKKSQATRGLVHKLSFARLKIKPSKSKENVSPARSSG